MNNKFGQLFDELVNEISKSYCDEANLSRIIDEIINYIKKIMSKSFKIIHVTKEDIEKAGSTAFMYSAGNVISYSTEMIKDIQFKLKTTKFVDYNPDYNDVTYSMFLIDSIAHELWHCKQYEDNIKGIITEQTYLNSLCQVMFELNKISYLDNSYEGDAYGNGVAIMRNLCIENNSINQIYTLVYKKQIESWNFFKKNLLFHEAIYYLDKIPFMNIKGGFVNIIGYANNYLSKLDKSKRDSLIKRYPLITIGINEENNICYAKNSYELMEQYFGNYIKYGRNKCSLNKQERIVLDDLYIYLLIPQLNFETYNNLCIKHGYDKIEEFMLSLKENINKKIVLYNNAYQNSLARIKQIRKTDQNILQNIDEKYATDKHDLAIACLNSYNRKIDEFIGNTKRNIK